ncbi:MAG: hypothetical protein AAF307_03570 [Pseudomonadota bacterium]
MTQIYIALPDETDPARVPALIEGFCAQVGMQITLTATLKMYPGCTHWHLKNGARSGILEVTWWPRDAKGQPDRLWLSVHRNRRTPWTDDFKPVLKALLEAALKPEA